jgi:hypothetical protein
MCRPVLDKTAKQLDTGIVSTIEEMLGRKNSGSGLENREYGLSVGIIRLRTKATEFVLFVLSRVIKRVQSINPKPVYSHSIYVTILSSL